MGAQDGAPGHYDSHPLQTTQRMGHPRLLVLLGFGAGGGDWGGGFPSATLPSAPLRTFGRAFGGHCYFLAFFLAVSIGAAGSVMR